MKKPLTILTLCFVAVGLVLSCSQTTPTYLLKFKYAAGSVLTYEQTVKGTVTAKERDSVTIDKINSVTSQLEYTVRRVVDDTTVELVQTSTSQSHSVSRIDSTVTDTTEVAPEITIYVSPNGRVQDMVMGSGKDSEYSGYWKEYFRQGTPVFPSQPIAVGHTWTQTFSVTIDGKPVSVSTAYTINGVEKRQGHDCVAIGYSGRMVLPMKAAASDTTQRHGVDRISMNGTMYFAPDEGATIDQVEKWILDGERTKLRDGKEVSYTVKADYDVTMELKGIKKS